MPTRPAPLGPVPSPQAVSETPPGQGFGAAAVTVAEAYFRFRPPMSASGRPVEGQRVTVFVQFGR